MDRMEWIQEYGNIWSERDWSLGRIARLCTEDAIYRPNVAPTIEPAYVGHAGIVQYLDRTVPTLEWTDMVVGDLVMTDDCMVIQSWLQGMVKGEPTTEILCTFVRFAADGRCRESRDFPVIIPGHVAPFDGWSPGTN
jgi:hypothetical protein